MRLGLAPASATRVALICLAVGAASGCTDTVRLPLEIVAPTDAEASLDLEVVVTSDSACPSEGARPERGGATFREGDEIEIDLPRGSIAVWVGAWSGASCGAGRCYAGCSTAEVRRDATLQVTLGDAECSEVCRDATDGGLDGGAPADAGDGGFDADVDGGDGGDGGDVDGGLDGGVDGGPPPPSCRDNGYVQVAVGYDHTCALHVDGTVRCWGVNTRGEAGAPPSADVGPTEVPLPDDATEIGCGADFSCALVRGEVFCWGNDDATQDRNGDGTRNNSNHEASAPVVGISTAVDLAVGYWHACAALEGGGVRCWGQNASSEHGSGEPCTDVGTCPQRDGSTASVGITTATAVAAGLGSSCALEDDGAVRCWGFNAANQLALATGADDVIPSPTAVVASGSALTGLTTLTSKGTRTFFDTQFRAHTCGVDDADRVLCWGANDHGQSSTAAADIVGVSRSFQITGAHEVVAGANHSCAIYGADRRVTCWGADGDGQLGDGAAGADTRGPADLPIADLTDVCSISAGERHTCATRADGSVWCWGSNANRRLGDTGSATSLPRRIVLP